MNESEKSSAKIMLFHHVPSLAFPISSSISKTTQEKEVSDKAYPIVCYLEQLYNK